MCIFTILLGPLGISWGKGKEGTQNRNRKYLVLRKTGKFGYFITSAKNQSRRAYAIDVHTPDVTWYFISMLSRQLIECSVTLVTMVIFGTFYPAGPGTDPGLPAQVREGRTSTYIWKLLYHRSEPPTVPAPILGYSVSS